MADEVLTAFDSQLRDVVRPSLDGGLFERVGPVIRCLSNDPSGWNGVEWSSLDESTADAVIADQIAYFTGHGRRFEWKYYSYDRPADLPARLRAAGLSAGEEEAVLVAAVADTPLDTPPPPGITLREATTDEDLRLVKRVHDEVFGGDHGPMVEAMRARMASGALAAVLALAGDEPVCAARVDFHVGTDFASLWGGGTVAPWRRRGIYRAMVAHRARLADDRGYRYLRTDALPTSRPTLERLGFKRICTTVPFTQD